ncbi:mitogen-activated protein kinase kinase kinase 20-like [Nicotiana tabacum]|uniref:Mitogen-activated protein kinase kinase kinase 20-like n=2 Tax=Nicotiana TaxID=4085 RepID=A0A1S4CBN6_TOBAC|nr:PREDICTED: mitogen-activated protein kinase kinase kinase NPK1-like [Nicotiana sylvestris]XP_016498531.1 PREDICTED: mitogen-activated protein kinase kinase kinase NPK1-like [Nicotiana tabacum]
MDWVRGEAVGHGSFGKVSFAIPRKQSTQAMVVKSSAASRSTTLMNEKTILDELKSCPNIIRCLGDNYSYENGEKLYNVLLEYAAGGDLSNKLKNSGDHRLPEFEVKKYTKALLKGLHYIHKTGYVHCDIKLQNILLGDDGQVKIADFGLAKRVESKKDDNLRCELRGTPLYMAPEMVTGGEQGTPADIWALGCVVAEMAAGVPVWNYSNITQLLMTIGVGDELPEFPAKLSEQGKDFLEKCFVKDPRKRWTAEMLLNHPFVADQHYDDATVTLNDETCGSGTPSTSPRCPFDFPDWVSDASAESSAACSITSLPSPAIQELLNLNGGSWSTAPAERLRVLVGERRPESDWSAADDWVSVR